VAKNKPLHTGRTAPESGIYTTSNKAVKEITLIKVDKIPPVGGVGVDVK
jgi:hypothetical protein